MSMRVYRCNNEGCGKGLITEFQPWDFCPKCGGTRWKKLRKATYWTTLRIWWISGRQLIVPPEGSWLERFVLRHWEDQAENSITEEEVRRNVPKFFWSKGGSRG